MAKLSIQAGSTSETVNIFIQDSSVSTGAGLTGLAFNTASLTAYYTLPRAAPVAITLATLAANNSAWSSGGFKEIDSANNKGLYRLDLPNAALAAASGRFVTVLLQGATNMAPCVLEIELTGWNNQDGVRGGMTALPNAAAGAAGGLVSGTTGNAYDASNMTAALKQSLADTTITRTMAESYSTRGSPFTLAQSLYDIHQYLVEGTVTFGSTTSTRTVNKRDQATPAKTFTMNSASDPTAITETS